MIYNSRIRLFTNVELPSWQTTINLTTFSRLYSGNWFNYHIYKVLKRDDNEGILHIHSFSPLEHLYNNTNDKFYCYYKYQRCFHYEKYYPLYMYTLLHNSYISNKPIRGELIKIPSNITEEDRLVIYKEPTQFDNTCFPNFNNI